MRSRRAPTVAGVLCGLAVLLVSLPSSMSSAAVQQPGPGAAAPPPGRADPKAASRERQGREAMLRGAGLLSRATVDGRSVQVAAEKVKQDFKHIQVLRNNIARHLTAGRLLDYKFISAEAKEVNKRANRLREYLVPHAPEDWAAGRPGAPDLGGEQLTEVLVTLCQRIDDFTENPVFKVIGVVNVEQSAKAADDLRTIILLSSRIKEDAARLNKATRR